MTTLPLAHRRLPPHVDLPLSPSPNSTASPLEKDEGYISKRSIFVQHRVVTTNPQPETADP